jgi:hypothetical protein
MMYLNRMRSMFISPVQRAMGEYAGQQLQAQQAMYMAGLPTGMAGAPIDILQGQARMAQFRAGLGEAGYQAWGGLMGGIGRQNQPLAAGLAIGAPALGIGMAGAYLAGPAAAGPVGIAAGGIAAAVGAAGYVGGAARDREAIAMAGAQAADGQQGFGQWLTRNFRGAVGALARGFQQMPEWAQRAGPPGQLAGMIYGLATGRVGFQPEDIAYGQQIQRGDLAQLVDPQGRLAAMQYFNQQVLAPQLPGMEPAQVGALTAGYMGMTGQQVTSQFNQQLMVQAGQRAQMLGIAPGAAFQEFTGMAGQLGGAPMGGLGLGIAQYALGMPNERQRQAYMWQLGNVAPMARGAQEMFGLQYGAEAFAPGGTWAELGGAGMGPERRRTGMMLAGNRQLWSDWGRQTGRQDLITMEEGGLPIYTQELRGLQDEQTALSRERRDWQMGQQWEQMQATQQYTRAQWGVQDQLRGLQAQRADWQFGYQQRQFEMGGAQWQQRFDLAGQQRREAMGLGRQIFEARAGWQQQDYAQQAERRTQQEQWWQEDWAYGENRAQLQFGWRMEDLSESIRFSTGRQRRQLMQQQERGTIMESMRRQQSLREKERHEEQQQWADEDFEEAKERNELLIQLQREQFDMRERHFEEDREMAMRHHEETRAMQVEQMEKSREFYEENRRLDDERIKLQREHAEMQFQWQEEAFERQKEYIEGQDHIADAMRDYQRQQQDAIAAWQRLLVYSEELRGSFQSWMESAGYQGGSTSYQRSIPTPHQAVPMQQGGPVTHPIRAKLGEAGEEYVVPSGGALVLSDEKSTEQRTAMLAILERIARGVEKGGVVIVESMNPQKAREHVLTLEDAAWGMMPS